MATPLEEIVQKMIDAGESEKSIAAVIKEYRPAKPSSPVEGGPENYWSGFLTGAKEGALGGAKGYVKGLVPGVGAGLVGLATLPIGLLREAISTTKGIGRFIDDPQGTLADVYETLKGTPGKALDAVQAAMQLAATDPEAFGKEAGKIVGNTAVGVATAKVVPLLPRPLAETVGTAAESFGKKSSWPLRITGAHQIIGGNVLGGIATMSTPGLMEQGGSALKNWGQNVKVPTRLASAGDVVAAGKRAAPGAVRLTPEQIAFQEEIASNLNTQLKKAGNPAKEGLKDVDAAIAAEKKSAQGVRIASAKREADLKATETIDQTKAGLKLTARPPKVTETVKAPGQSMTTTYAPETEGGLSPLEQDLLARSQAGRPGAPTATQGIADRLAPRVAPLMVPREPVAASVPTPEALPAGTAEVPLDLPASRSSRAPSAIPGISAQDLEALKQILKDNPELSAEDAATELLKQRGQRQGLYRDQAILDKLEQAALDRDVK